MTDEPTRAMRADAATSAPSADRPTARSTTETRTDPPAPPTSAAPSAPTGTDRAPVAGPTAASVIPGADTPPDTIEPVDRDGQHVVLLSGLSGGGKTAAAKLFEDLGYTVVDNLPGELLPELAELVSSDRERFARIAIVVDVRAGNPTMALAAMRGALEGRGIRPRVVVLEARDD